MSTLLIFALFSFSLALPATTFDFEYGAPWVADPGVCTEIAGSNGSDWCSLTVVRAAFVPKPDWFTDKTKCVVKPAASAFCFSTGTSTSSSATTCGATCTKWPALAYRFDGRRGRL